MASPVGVAMMSGPNATPRPVAPEGTSRARALPLPMPPTVASVPDDVVSVPTAVPPAVAPVMTSGAGAVPPPAAQSPPAGLDVCPPPVASGDRPMPLPPSLRAHRSLPLQSLSAVSTVPSGDDMSPHPVASRELVQGGVQSDSNGLKDGTPVVDTQGRLGEMQMAPVSHEGQQAESFPPSLATEAKGGVALEFDMNDGPRRQPPKPLAERLSKRNTSKSKQKKRDESGESGDLLPPPPPVSSSGSTTRTSKKKVYDCERMTRVPSVDQSVKVKSEHEFGSDPQPSEGFGTVDDSEIS